MEAFDEKLRDCPTEIQRTPEWLREHFGIAMDRLSFATMQAASKLPSTKKRGLIYRLRNWWQNWRSGKAGRKALKEHYAKWGKPVPGGIRISAEMAEDIIEMRQARKMVRK